MNYRQSFAVYRVVIILFLFLKWDLVLAITGGEESSNRPSAVPLIIPQLPTKAPPIATPKEPVAKPSSSYDGSERNLQIDAVEFSGNTVITSDELQELAKSYLHKPVSVHDLDELRKLVTHYYIDKGYVTSGATFPAHAIQGKILRISIIEGRLGEMRIEGNEWLSEAYVKSRLVEDQDAPLNMNELQNRFRLLLTDPLFDHLNGRLIPGQERGVSILDLEITRARPYQLSFVSDNYRTPSIGSIAMGGNGWVRNLTKLGDIVDFSYMQSEGSQQLGGSWVVPVWDYGTKVYFMSSHSSSRITDPNLKALDILSDTFSVEGGLNQLIIDNLDRRLTFGGGVGFKQNATTLLGHSFSFIPGQLNGQTQVSFVRFNQEYIERWATQVLAVRSTFSVGLDSFGATINSNRLNPSSDYFAWLGQGQYNWHLPYLTGADLVVKGNLQLANSPLLPLERIAVGGRYSVRGYRENQLVRDNGYSGTTELHFSLLPLFGNNELSSYRLDLVPFFDYGSAWNNQDSTSNKPVHDYLYSSGIGIQIKLPHVNSELYWAHPLLLQKTRTTGDLQDDGIHFQVRVDAF
jgi:hemolysin activation/secretion protein